MAVPGEASLVAAACSSLAYVWDSLPDEADDGGVYELLVHLNMLAGLTWSLATGRSACEGWLACTSANRGIFAVLCTAVPFAKLNKDYHDVRRSAGAVLTLLFADGLTARCGVPVSILDYILGDRGVTMLLRAGLVGLEVAEWLVPICLFSGCVEFAMSLSWIIYMMRGVAAFEFSSLMVASIPLWLPQHHLHVLQWLTVTPNARFCSLILAVLLLGPLLPQKLPIRGSPVHLIALFWMVAANPLLYVWIPRFHSEATALPEGCSSAATQSQLIWFVGQATVALALLNSVSPYLGIKTQATWTMFSNLRVEGGVSNHFLIPSSFQLFGYTSECITVTRTDVPSLNQFHLRDVPTLQVFGNYAERAGMDVAIHSSSTLGTSATFQNNDSILPYAVPFFQLRSIVAGEMLFTFDNFSIEYLHCDAPHRFEVRHGLPLPGCDLRLTRAPPRLLRKFLIFRSLPSNDFSVCSAD